MHRMKTPSTCVLIAVCGISLCFARQTQASLPEKQLDFWVGEWTVTDSTPNAKNPTGENSIRRLYGGKVIHESFKMGTFEGQSWSVYNPKLKRWQQTWVDNNGAYIAMNSGVANGNLAIQTIRNAATPNSASRMVFTNVKPDSFTWRWEATKDGGKTWKLSWRLEYKRKKQSESDARALMKAISHRVLIESFF